MQPIISLAGRQRPGISKLAGLLIIFFASGCGLAMDNEDRLARGEAAFADGDVRAAIIDAKEVLREEPDNLRGRLLLGRASVAAGDGPTAEKELRRAIVLGAEPASVAANLALALLQQGKFEQILTDVLLDDVPQGDDEATVRRVHGDAYMGLRQPDTARELYTSALEIRDNDLDAQLGIVNSYITEGNIPQANAALEHVLQTNNDSPRTWLFSGAFNLRLGNFETAQSNFQVALDLATEQGDAAIRSQAVAGLAETLLEQENVQDARRQLEILQTEAPQSFQTTLLAARMAYIDEDWTTAQQNLQQILRVAPNYRPAQMLLGAVHLRSGNLSQAEQYLAAAVASLPNDRRARQLLAETRLQMQKVAEAQEVLAPIVGGDDADELSLQMAARASIVGENVDEALAYLRRNIELNPDNIDLKFQLVATLLQYGRTEEADAVLDAIDVEGSPRYGYYRDALNVMKTMVDGQSAVGLALAKKLTAGHPEEPGAFGLLGAVMIANNDVPGAVKSFEKSLELDPKAIPPQRYLAAIEEARGNLEAASERYRNILAIEPDAPWAHFAIGRIAYRSQDFSAAAEGFREAMRRNPNNQNYRLSLAKAEKELGKPDEAERLLEAEYEAALDNIPSAVFLATLYYDKGDFDEAMELAELLQNRFPDSSVPHALEGELYFDEGDMQRAQTAYEAAVSRGQARTHARRLWEIRDRLGAADKYAPLVDYLEARPLDAEMRLILAQAYMGDGENTKAITEYEQAIEHGPNNVIALNNLAWLYHQAGDARAAETAKKAHELLPNNSSILDTLGWILVETGNVEEGERHLRKALELGGKQVEIRYHHAVALARLGKKAEARTALNEILASDDDFDGRDDAEKLLADL